MKDPQTTTLIQAVGTLITILVLRFVFRKKK